MISMEGDEVTVTAAEGRNCPCVQNEWKMSFSFTATHSREIGRPCEPTHWSAQRQQHIHAHTNSACGISLSPHARAYHVAREQSRRDVAAGAGGDAEGNALRHAAAGGPEVRPEEVHCTS